MDLPSALNAALSPLARAVLLTMESLRGCGAWDHCGPDGSPTDPPRAAVIAAASPAAEAHYSSEGVVVCVKWVPMDEQHVVVVAQRRGHAPVSATLSVADEPLAAATQSTAPEWTADSAATAAAALQPMLRETLISKLGLSPSGSQQQQQQHHQHHEQHQPRVRPEEPRLASPPAALSVGGDGLFGRVAPRPPGFRYGDGDLIPGGAISPGVGGMLFDPRAFTPGSAGAAAPPHARYDPMFPGDRGAHPLFRGEPDPDHLRMPGGPPFGPGSAFGPGAAGFGRGPTGGHNFF